MKGALDWSMANILLDPYGDAVIPDGYTLIDSEVAFLESATSQGKWLIRGRRLCEWAEGFFAGRNIRVQEALSPTRELRRIIPGLSDEQSAEIWSKLGAHFYELDRPLTARSVAYALFPHRFWQIAPSPEHGAEWLLWLGQQPPDPVVESLLNVVVIGWQLEAQEELKTLYEATRPEQAREILDGWLGVNPNTPLKELGEFPVEVPSDWLGKAARSWRRNLIQTHGAFIESLLQHPMPKALRDVMAQEAVHYFTQNPQHLSDKYFDRLVSYTSRQQWGELRKLLRPPEPSDLPGTPEEVCVWFKEEYLPFREWQALVHDQPARQRVLELAHQFAEWYLGFYPRALVSADTGFLCFNRAGALRQPETRFVTLLIVLDGLLQRDAQHMLQKLQTETKRLAILNNTLAFASIPTVTQFAKEALVKGVWPKDTVEVSPLGQEISERASPLERLRTAKAGELFIWQILEPDRTYHTRNTDDALEREIEGRLNAIAGKIADIVNQLPAKIVLRIVLTSDHGRLLSVSERRVPIPGGMQAHGRAAWGRIQREFPTPGFVVEGNVVYLCGERYGLLEDTAVILDEDAFLTNDGKQGSERYAHGGLFPEEVFVPWIVLERDVAPVQRARLRVEVEISGHGISGQTGTINVRVLNAEEIPIILRSVRVDFGKERQPETFALESEIPETKELIETREWNPWPSRKEAMSASATAVLCWPNGECDEIKAYLEIESKEMYWRDTSIIEDLDV